MLAKVIKNNSITFVVLLFIQLNMTSTGFAQHDIFKYQAGLSAGKYFSASILLDAVYTTTDYNVGVFARIGLNNFLYAGLSADYLKYTRASVSDYNILAGIQLGYKWDNGMLLKKRSFIAPFHELGLSYLSGQETSLVNTGNLRYSFNNGLKFRLSDRLALTTEIDLMYPKEIFSDWKTESESLFKIGLSYYFSEVKSKYKAPELYASPRINKLIQTRDSISKKERSDNDIQTETEDNANRKAGETVDSEIPKLSVSFKDGYLKIDAGNIEQFEFEADPELLRKYVGADSSTTWETINESSLSDYSNSANEKTESELEELRQSNANLQKQIDLLNAGLYSNTNTVPDTSAVDSVENAAYDYTDYSDYESTTDYADDTPLGGNNIGTPVSSAGSSNADIMFIKNQLAAIKNQLAMQQAGDSGSDSNYPTKAYLDSEFSSLKFQIDSMKTVMNPDNDSLSVTPETAADSEVKNELSQENKAKIAELKEVIDSLQRANLQEKETEEELISDYQKLIDENRVVPDKYDVEKTPKFKTLKDRSDSLQKLVFKYKIKEEQEILLNKENEAEKTDFKVEYPVIVSFDMNSSVIKKKYHSTLDKLAIDLQENPKLTAVAEGYTDKSGNSKYNKYLSMKRAKSVRSYLMLKNISKERIVVKSWGDSKASSEAEIAERVVKVSLLKYVK
ncbi:MAG: OmpA family protein [Bacteroidota bacterium]|nr:OmpA family protein [Bacteroidota bacterium]